MTRKEALKSEILMKMKNHLDKTILSILETVLTEELYHVDIVDSQTLPATINMTNDYILRLYDLKKGQKLSPETMKAYMVVFREFIRYTNKNLLQVTTEDVDMYLRKKKLEGNQNTSLNNKRRKLNTFFDWMRKMDFITKNPVESIEPYPEVLKPIDHLAPDEFEDVRAACKTIRDRALVEWLSCTAMRKGEVVTVNINQINWQTGQVVIYGSKGRAFRTVCLDAVAIKYLQAYIRERGLDTRSSEPLFTNSRGDKRKPLTKAGIYASIHRLGDSTGLNRRIYPHLFRKTTATNIIRRGGNNDDAGEYLGHKPQGVAARHYAYRSEDHTVKIFQNYVAAV